MTCPFSFRELARSLGGEVVGADVLVPGPGHGARDQSQSVKISASSPDSFVCHSFAGDDWRKCQDCVIARLGLAFSFARPRSVVEDVAAALGVQVALLTQPTQKRLVGIVPRKIGTKSAARSEAICRWPSLVGLFARVADDGRAERALIGVAGLVRAQGLG
ncbi:MAG: hypothetical protein E7774_11625 [Bradyrhizobium sp.]|nr:MAG: hypothetical protein E7774_11625 [Bradyrhizobium sp.]